MSSSALIIFTSLYFLTSLQVFPKKLLFINLYRLTSNLLFASCLNCVFISMYSFNQEDCLKLRTL